MESMSTLEINVVSAKDLPQTNLVSKMVAYVVVSLSGDSADQKFKTNADSSGGVNPNWNFPMRFSIHELASTYNRETLVFTIRCFRTLGDRDVGEVHVPVAELLQSTGNRNSMQHVTYPVRKPSGKTHGLLNFQFKVNGGITASFQDEKPHAAYATRGIGFTPKVYPPPPQPTAGYPRPPYHTAYAPPPPQPYGYLHYGYPAPPPPPLLGYPPAAGVVEKKEKKSGMGKIFAVGAGIIGGLVSGVMLGECAADLGQGGYPAGPSGGGGGGGGGVYHSNLQLQSISASQNTLGGIG